MNHSFEFIVVKQIWLRWICRIKTVQQVACDEYVESRRRTFAARSDPQTRSQRSEALDAVPIACVAGKNIVAIIRSTINALRRRRMTERASLFFPGARQS